jgi:hypothetical protein
VYWIYKCNSRRQPYQVAYGDWRDFFLRNAPQEWGSTEWVPALRDPRPGHTIIAYQTDRNELVGLAKVTRHQRRAGHLDLILAPVQMIGAKVRPLKQRYKSIRQIPALQPGPIKTLYHISD